MISTGSSLPRSVKCASGHVQVVFRLIGVCIVLCAVACSAPAQPEPVAPQVGQAQHASPPDLSAAVRVRELLAAIFEDIASIADSFSGGLDNPTNPVNDPNTLKRDSERLDAATRKANQLSQVLDTIRNEGQAGGR